ncbi:cation:proton antiporter [Adlercreutzia sp. ZJ473]|uniref:cation:proton antiporter n=1 Tax=Adlercreutzia sp. ZJ473 TaxID=2722822 RepID=UPI0015521BF7
METLTLGLLLLAAVLVSSVIDQIVPKVSLPLIQIALGVVVALFASGSIQIALDPELFLVFFIAPLLYDEAKHADKVLLWRDRKPILSLAIGLVVVTTLIIGFAVNAVIPSIGLAAAFALGAALGPTDAVAVSSLSKQIDIPERQKSILKGELLLNDASGIVSFQFALAAAITGAFSLFDATADFLVEFFGGLVVGVVLGAVGNFIVRKVRDIGVENTTFHVLFEVFTPFLVYLISGALHVSGIIAVVVAGLVNVISPRTIGPAVARMNIVSSSVWRVLTFALNGVVFVLLGTQLPNAMRHTWDDVSIGNGMLVGYVIGLTFVLLAVRFAWCLAMEYAFVRRVGKRSFTLADAKTSLITTLCGAKGTITLSILFTIPVFIAPGVRFPQRDLIIFLACGVIVCTLLLATFVVPLLAPRRDAKQAELDAKKREVECNLEIMRSVIEELTSRQTPQNRLETQAVIRSYNDRLERIKEINDMEDEPNVRLRIEALHWERERTLELIEQKGVSGMVGYAYLARLEQVEQLLEHHAGRLSPKHLWIRVRAIMRRGLHSMLIELPTNSNMSLRAEEQRKLQVETATYAIARLEEKVASTEVPTEDATALLLEYQGNKRKLMSATPSVSTVIKTVSRTDDIRRYALQLELEQIQTMYEEERLSRAAAKRMRENVHLMQLDLDNHV